MGNASRFADLSCPAPIQLDMRAARLPIIAVSMGDPAGVGPEVLVKALADPSLWRIARFCIHGSVAAMHAAAEKAGIAPFWVLADSPDRVNCESHPAVLVMDRVGVSDVPLEGGPTQRGGALSFAYVEQAIAACQLERGNPCKAQAIVTGPISKEAWAMAGHGEFPGHTELLAARFAARRHAMMFITPRLRVVLATGHMPLMRVGQTLTKQRIVDVMELAVEACHRIGIERPRIAVCGLNPHAGEAGLLGEEDERIIAPAVAAAREAGLDASGPYPGDTIFSAALAGKFDLVVAMYHDQGLIPVKLLDFHQAVNVTLGLPIIRTSPDHGTAFDIAGRNLAEEGSMRHALELAVDLSATPTGVV